MSCAGERAGTLRLGFTNQVKVVQYIALCFVLYEG
jgi:hypothetical protein